MTRHGMVQPSAARGSFGDEPSCLERVDRRRQGVLLNPSLGRQCWADAHQNRPTASTRSLSDSAHAIADISRKQKSP